MNTYPINSVVRASCAFTNLAGAAADPTATTFTWRTPAGVVTTWTYGVDGGLVKDSTGTFHADMTAAAAGTWDWEFRGTGAVTAQTPTGQFEVLDSLITGTPVAYATVADFTATYEIPPTGRDARIQAVLEEASAQLTAAIGWDFYRHPASAGTEQRTLDVARAARRLCVHEGIVSLTAVEYRGGPSDAWTALTSDDWYLDPRTGSPAGHVALTGTVAATWPIGVATVRLTGVFGYAKVPTEVRRATVALARQIYRADATTPGGAFGPDELGGGVAPAAGMWPREAYDVSLRYRQLYMGCHV